MHFTNVMRSKTRKKDMLVPKRQKKFKYEIGISFPKDFFYPEVFFRYRPKIVQSVWGTPRLSFKLRAFIETPLRKIYRRTLLNNKKYGY